MALPLDSHIQIVRSKFPKYVPIEETTDNTFPKSGVLFRKQHYNDYCFLEYHQHTESIVITIFKCDWNNFEKIESAFVDDSFSFNVKDDIQTRTILDSLT